MPYLHSVQRHCDEVVVDDDDLLNEPGAATVDVSTDWIADEQTAGYYGSGYRWASTQTNATDGVSFSFFVGSPESLTVDAPLDERPEPLAAGRVPGDRRRRRHSGHAANGPDRRRQRLARAGHVDVHRRLEPGGAAAAGYARLRGGGRRGAGAAVVSSVPAQSHNRTH